MQRNFAFLNCILEHRRAEKTYTKIENQNQFWIIAYKVY